MDGETGNKKDRNRDRYIEREDETGSQGQMDKETEKKRNRDIDRNRERKKEII